MINLKNISNELEPRTGGSTIDTYLTTHPLSNTREWTEEPKDKWTGNVDKKQMKGFNPADRSEKFHIVIAPGETKEFENEEHALYLYLLYGNPEGHPEKEAPVRNWLVEVDEKGVEDKSRQSLWDKHRKLLPKF